MDPKWNFSEPFPAQPQSPQGSLGPGRAGAGDGEPSRVRVRTGARTAFLPGPCRAPGGFSVSSMLHVFEGFSCL